MTQLETGKRGNERFFGRPRKKAPFHARDRRGSGPEASRRAAPRVPGAVQGLCELGLRHHGLRTAAGSVHLCVCQRRPILNDLDRFRGFLAGLVERSVFLAQV